MKIAITGVGGGVGQSVLKSLYNSGYELLALDGENLAAGLYAGVKSCLIPYANSADYIPELLKICKEEKVAVLFPGLDAELMILSRNRHLFAQIGTTVIVSDESVIDISDDKLLTFSALTQYGVHVPMTYKLSEYSAGLLPYPLIIKQMVGGARSKNVFKISSLTEYESAVSVIGTDLHNYIVQEYIDGDEYTCGSISFEGSCKGVIVMKRILRDGDTYKCFSINNPIIENCVYTVVNAIKPFGACNIQLRLKDGVPYVFEINARCSGTTASRTLCGFNEPQMIVDYLIKGKQPEFNIKYQSVLRYWKELVVPNEFIDQIRSERSLHKPGQPQL